MYIPENTKTVMVALSGGADSLALTHMLSHNLAGIQIHAVTIDHGLRPESDKEAMQVSELVMNFPNTRHVIVRWEGEKPLSRMQELARQARYQLLKDYAQAHDIKRIFLGHHMDDQAETFLIRLAKGSGLKGLSCMRELSQWEDDIALIRPLLNQSHQELVSYCEENNLSWIEDPSNQNLNYLRPRLRKSKEVLEKEGLSSKRLALTAQRLSRAEAALDEITKKIWKDIKRDGVKTVCFSLSPFRVDYKIWADQPEEIRLRLLLKIFNLMQSQGQERDGEDEGRPHYAPRMEKIEDLARRLADPAGYKNSTLGGIKFTMNAKQGQLICEKEG